MLKLCMLVQLLLLITRSDPLLILTILNRFAIYFARVLRIWACLECYSDAGGVGSVSVCGPSAFVNLRALSFSSLVVFVPLIL